MVIHQRISIKFFCFLFMLVPLISVADVCNIMEPIDSDPYRTEIGSRKVTFLVLDYRSNKCRYVNKTGLTERHGPYSTFKIPHSLIALETGAVKAVDEPVEWNPEQYPAKDFWPETWKQSHTLASAFKHSAVWYYKALVPQVKPADYKKWLARFQYGDQVFTAGSDAFWLDNELKISPLEQVNFIACLLKDRCGVSAKNFAIFESIALQESRGKLLLYAKTGAGSIDPNNNDGAFNGWYVGYIKGKDGKPRAAFALYMEAESFAALKDYRRALSLQLLEDLGLWEE